jgi:hypothetical protein
LFQNTSNGVTQVGVLDANGNVTVKSYGTSTGGTTTSNLTALKNYIAQKKSLEEVFAKFKDTISPNTIYQTYNDHSPWGVATESAAELKSKYNVTAGTITQANINRAKQIVIQNGGTDEDQKRCETDPDFVNWLIANY